MSSDTQTESTSLATTAVPPSRDWRWFALVAGAFSVGAFIYLFDLSSYRSLTTHEGFVAVTSREMLETGDWVVPRYGEIPRLKKPPMAYWVAATSSWLLGGSSEWAVRLPSVIAALLLAALVGWWASQWYGRRAGLGAAIVQLSSLYVITFARLAEVDMQLCLLTTSAMYLISKSIVPADSLGATRERITWRDMLAGCLSLRWTLIYAVLGLAWLAKFHYGPVMVLAATGMFVLVQRRWSAIVQMVNPLGLLIFAAAVGVWPYLVLRQLPEAWDIWQAETVGRAVGQLGADPFWYYIPKALLLGQPWTPFTIAAMAGSYRLAWREHNARERFLWIWFLTQFLILSASAFKHGHYLMCALPVFSMLGGRTLARIVEKAQRGEELLGTRRSTGIAVGCLVTAVAVGIVIAKKWPAMSGAGIALGLLIGLGGVMMVAGLRLRRYAVTVATAAVVLVGCHMAVAGWIFPGRDHRLPAVDFATNVRRELPPVENVCVYGLQEHPVVYYLREPLYRLESRDTLAEHLQRDGRLYVVTSESTAGELMTLGRAQRIHTLTSSPGGPTYKEAPLVLLQLDPSSTAPQLSAHDDLDVPAQE